MECTGQMALGMAPQIWMLLFSLAGFGVGYALCKRQCSKTLAITLTNRLEETFVVHLGPDRFEIKTLDAAVMLAENFLTLQLLPPDHRKEILGLQQIFLEKGEDALFSAARAKGANVKWCWRCRKELPVLHEFCIACAWHDKFEEYYEDEYP